MGLLDQIRVDLRDGKILDRLPVVHFHALFEHLQDVEILEIVDHHKIRQIAGRNGPPVIEQEVPGRMVAGHLYRQDGVRPPADGLPDVIVDVALFQQVAGVLIVAAEHTPVRVLLRQQGQQRLQVPGGGALPDHDELAPLQLGDGVRRVGALVVGVDSGGNVGVEIIPRQAGGMAVDLLVVGLSGHDLLDDHGVRSDDAGVVHHFRQPLDPGMVIEGVDSAVIQHRPTLVHGRGGDTGGQHEAHIHRQILGGLQHVLHAVGAHDIGDLVRVSDDGGGAVGQHRLDELPGGNHGALQVDVGIDKAGKDQPAGHIVLRLPAVLTHAHDQPLRHGNIPMTELAGEHIDVDGVFQHQIGLLPARGHLDDPQLLAQLAVNPASVAFSSHKRSSFSAYMTPEYKENRLHEIPAAFGSIVPHAVCFVHLFLPAPHGGFVKVGKDHITECR